MVTYVRSHKRRTSDGGTSVVRHIRSRNKRVVYECSSCGQEYTKAQAESREYACKCGGEIREEYD